MQKLKNRSFLLRRGWLYARGVLLFGPARTQRAQVTVRRLLDAFEEYHGCLPNDQEQRQLMRKCSWFEQQYRRAPTPEEAAQQVQQLDIK